MSRDVPSLAAGLLGAMALSCGGSSSGSSTGKADGGPPTYDTSSPSAGCGLDAGAAPGTTTVQLMSGGLARSYILHVPPGYDGRPTPLVINIHGFSSTAKQQEAYSGMDSTADSESFIVAYPSGAGSPISWNAGDCCEYFDTSRDDVAFISALIDDVGRTACIALDRVYAAGMSNGGFMAHDLACNLSERIAAIGPVSGVIGVPPSDCGPGRPIPVMEFHGTADPFVPYDGGFPQAGLWSIVFPGVAPPTFQSVPDTIAFWRGVDGCSGAAQQTYSSGNAICETYGGCQGGAVVTLCTIEGGGHTWPGGDPSALPSGASALTGPMSTSIDASQQLWSFFKNYKIPAGFDGGITVPQPYGADWGTAPSDGGDVDAGTSEAAED